MSQKINTSLNNLDRFYLQPCPHFWQWHREVPDVGLTHRELMIIVTKWNMLSTDYMWPCIRCDEWKMEWGRASLCRSEKGEIIFKVQFGSHHWREGRRVIGLKMGSMAKSVVIGNWFWRQRQEKPRLGNKCKRIVSCKCRPVIRIWNHVNVHIKNQTPWLSEFYSVWKLW